METIKINNVYNIDCVEGLRLLADSSIDLTVTSPPYDDLRKYSGSTWEFCATADELFRVSKNGAVVVWVVGDSTVKGSESGTSFRQALYFKEIGFKLHDTMIYKKTNYMPSTCKRYSQEFEYMFVFSKGAPKTFNPIRIPCKYAGHEMWGRSSTYDKNGVLKEKGKAVIGETKIKGNIFEYRVGNTNSEHPAIFPEQLAEDQIISWSNPGDIVLDPFAGSGTTLKAASKNGRHYIGFDISSQYCELCKRRLDSCH